MRAPLTIWILTVREVARLAALTGSVLVLVMAFGATVRFYAEGQIGPIETLRFMALAAIPMLHYTLPFAAGFASTLAYHRMSQDNELAGAYAGGIGHASLLVPALAAGGAISVGLAFMDSEISPRYWRRMEALVTVSAPRLVERAIRSGQPLGNILVHADRVERIDPPPGSLAQDALLLAGVAFVELGADGEVRSDGTASRGVVWLYPSHVADPEGSLPASTLVRVDIESLRVRQGEAFSGESALASPTWRVPAGLGDDPKFLTGRELARSVAEPDRYDFIATRARALAVALARREVERRFVEAIRYDRRLALSDAEGSAVIVRARGIRGEPGGWALEDPEGIVVERVRSAGSPRLVTRYLAAGGRLSFERAEEGHEGDLLGSPARGREGVVGLRLDLRDVSIIGEPGEPGGPAPRRAAISIGGLSIDGDPLRRLLSKPARRLLAEDAAPWVGGARRDDAVGRAAGDLERRLARMEREVMSKQHERLAMATACLVMVLGGAVTAMRLGRTAPLVVYLWSFFPALIAVLTISGGQQVVHEHGTAGLVMLWGGVGVLAAYALGAYVVVVRH